MPPHQPLQRTRAAPRDRYYFTASLRAEPCFDLDGAPLNGRALGARSAHHMATVLVKSTITLDVATRLVYNDITHQEV